MLGPVPVLSVLLILYIITTRTADRPIIFAPAKKVSADPAARGHIEVRNMGRDLRTTSDRLNICWRGGSMNYHSNLLFHFNKPGK